jgi:hypothetical protein
VSESYCSSRSYIVPSQREEGRDIQQGRMGIRTGEGETELKSSNACVYLSNILLFDFFSV